MEDKVGWNLGIQTPQPSLSIVSQRVEAAAFSVPRSAWPFARVSVRHVVQRRLAFFGLVSPQAYHAGFRHGKAAALHMTQPPPARAGLLGFGSDPLTARGSSAAFCGRWQVGVGWRGPLTAGLDFWGWCGWWVGGVCAVPCCNHSVRSAMLVGKQVEPTPQWRCAIPRGGEQGKLCFPMLPASSEYEQFLAAF